MIKKIYKKIFLELFENARVICASFSILRTRNKQNVRYLDHSVVIFSKDRPLQLEALIESYYHYTKNPTPPHIIYHASNDAFENTYQSLFSKNTSKLASLHCDKRGFKTTLLQVLNSMKTSHIFFLVDDIIFKNHFDPNYFFKNSEKTIPSLRMGDHLTKCYTQNREQPLPNFLDSQGDFLKWYPAKSTLDWAYSLSVDGHLFPLVEVKKMTWALSFRAPNTYESKLQKFRHLYRNHQGSCYKDSIIMNIPCNKVQSENDNICGELHQDTLLDMFKENRIDFSKLGSFKNISCHQDIPLSFTKRQQ